MFPARTRHAARITAAAVGGVLAAGLTLPGGAAAQMYKANDNGVLAYSTTDRIAHTIFVNGQNDSVVSTFDSPLGVPGEVGGWSVDGNRLLVVNKPTSNSSELRDVNPWTQAQVARVDEAFGIFGPSMSPDGTAYAYGSATGVKLHKSGEGTTDLWPNADGSEGTAWSSEDHLLVGLNGPMGIYRFLQPLDGSTTGDNWVMSDDPTFPLSPSISRDGQRAAYAALGISETGPTTDVFWLKADGSESPVRLEPGTTDGSNEDLATIAPDGSKVAFVSDRLGDGYFAIYTIDLPTAENPNPDQTAHIVPNTTTTKAYTGLSWQPADVPYLAEGSITTSPEIGNTIKQDPAFDMPTAPVTTQWQWQRCTNVVGTPNNYTSGDCVDMNGETGEGYKLLPGDVGAQFRVVRKVTNGAGTDTQASEITEPAYVPDSTPPGVPTIDTKPAARSNTLSPTFTWTGAEAGGTYLCSLDGASFTTCTSGSTFNVVGEGPHTFRVKQRDDALNTGDPAEHTWNVDVTTPSTPNVTAQPAAVTKSTAATIEFTGDEVDGTFECRVGKELWEACTSPVTLTELPEGAKSYSIRQVDAAGNVSDLPALVEWTVDTTPPLAPTFGTNDPAVYTVSHDRAFTGEADGTYECQLDDSAWEACTSAETLTGYTSGPHTFRVRQTDAAGNTGPAGEDTFTAYVDGPAAPTLQHKPAEFTKLTDASFSWYDNGGVLTASFECRLDAGAWEACTSGKTFNGLTEAKHTFEVRAIGTNAVAGTPTKHEWTVDTHAPAKPVLTNLPPAQTTDPALNVGLTVEAGAILKCRIDGNTNANGAWAYCGADLLKFPSFPLGKHTFEILQVDKAGNESEPASFAWEVVEKLAEPETPAQPETPAKPETPVTPVVPQTPAVETPVVAETPKATTTTTPKTETVTPATAAKPKLTALIGGTGNGGSGTSGTGNGNGNGTSSAATITVKNDGVGVGCSITGTVLTSCTVDLYAAAPATGATARAAAAKQVLVGTGTYRKADGSKKLEVDVTLNATGRALMRKSPDGLKVSVKITGTPVKGEKLEATGVATLVRQRVAATVGGFAVDRATLTPAAKRQLVKLARQVRGTAVAIRVVGHTDGSTTDSDYLKRLGARRARTVAAFLRAHGVKAKATLVSRGSAQPRATNSTKAGRALNRRVELRIDR